MTDTPIDISPTNHAEVNITLKFLQRDLLKQGEQLNKIEGKIDNLSNSFVSLSDFTEHLKADADHEQRIRSLESIIQDVATIKRIVYGGVGIVLVTVVTAIIYLVIK